MSDFFYVFLCIVSIKFLLNFSRYIKVRYYFRQYRLFGEGKSQGFPKYTSQIMKVFHEAGIKDSNLPNVEPAGYGFVSKTSIPVQLNMIVLREDIIEIVIRMFHRTIGVYRSRMIESISPIYWLEFVIFLPKHILTYIGISGESVFMKIVQVVYLLSVSLSALFKDELKPIIKNWLSSFMQ